MRQACLESKHWPDDVRIAVNVSSAEFQSVDLLDSIRNSLHDSGLSADRLEIEPP